MINGLAKLVAVVFRRQAAEALFPPRPVSVAYSPVSVGSYLQSIVTDAKHWPWGQGEVVTLSPSVKNHPYLPLLICW